MRTKVLALYLPQFYKTEYNDKWWGENYTEWTACKRAKPLYKNHYQPKVPLNENYYDLSIKENIKWEIELAQKYSVDGFVIYEYYSKGKVLLEKPLEIIRDNSDLNIDFCFCWANHSWRKSWVGQDTTILWPQEYGNEEEWITHFNYNLPYFKDDRYIKIDNKPVFFIFAAWHFKKIDEFIELWNKLAITQGFNGIYFVKTLDAHSSNRGQFDAVFYREPFYTFSNGFSKLSFLKRVIRTRTTLFLNKHFLKKKGIISYKCDYKKFWKSVVKRKYDKQSIPGAVFDWDNTARKNYNSQMMINFNVDVYEEYFNALYKNANDSGCPFIVFNAWNEWAEGAYLEPDDKHGFKSLEVINKVINDIEGS